MCMCVCVVCLHVAKRGGSPTELFSLPFRTNRSFSSYPLASPSPFTFRSHSLMHLKNIAYTMLYASFNRLLWAVHTKHTRTHVRNARRHSRNHTRIYFSRYRECTNAFTLSLSRSFVSRFDATFIM